MQAILRVLLASAVFWHLAARQAAAASRAAECEIPVSVGQSDSASPAPVPTPFGYRDQWRRADELRSAGEYRQAADLYEAAAHGQSQETGSNDADDQDRRALSLISAADAALDGGDLARARRLLQAARDYSPEKQTAALMEALDQQLRTLKDQPWIADGATSASDDPAASRRSGAGPWPASGDPRPDLDPPASVTASGPRRVSGFIFVAAGSGYDSNVAQAAAVAVDRDPTSVSGDGGWFASAVVLANVALAHRDGGSTELSYSFLQVAYAEATHDTYAFQDHLADLTHHVALGRKLRLSVTARAGATMTGLRDGLVSFQRSAGLDLGLTFTASNGSRSRLVGGVTGRQVLDADYSYLSGVLFEVSTTQEFQPRDWWLSAALIYRRELLGTIHDPLDSTREAVTSYSHHVAGLALRALSPSNQRLRVATNLRLEERLYSPSTLETTAATPDPGATGGTTLASTSARHDWRLTCAFELRAGRDPSIALRYDLTINRSNLDGTLGNPSYDYTRHVWGVSVDYGLWFL